VERLSAWLTLAVALTPVLRQSRDCAELARRVQHYETLFFSYISLDSDDDDNTCDDILID